MAPNVMLRYRRISHCHWALLILAVVINVRFILIALGYKVKRSSADIATQPVRLQSYNDIPLFVSLLDIAVGFDNLLKWILAVNDWF